MKSLRWLLLAALVAAWPAQAFWQSRDSNYNVSVSVAASYVGPGDVVSGAVLWWGLRCYNNAYSGNVADVYAPLDASHTLLTCSAGGVINQTLQSLATTCATSCTVKTLYDQTGNGYTLSNSTSAARPKLVLNAVGANPAMQFVSASDLHLTTGSFSQSQPYTYSVVANSTSGASWQCLISDHDGNEQLCYQSPKIQFASPSNVTVSMTQNAWHAIQAVANSASGAIGLDGVWTASLNAGSTGISTTSEFMGSDNSGDALNGYEVEAGIWPLAFNSTQASAMNTNQKAYWGY